MTPSHKPRIHPEALVRGRCDLSAGALIRVSIRLVSLAVHRGSRNLLELVGASFICLPSKVVAALRFIAHDKYLRELLFCFNKLKKTLKNALIQIEFYLVINHVLSKLFPFHDIQF